MGAKSSTLQGDDPGEGLVKFLSGEEIDQASIKNLLKFKVRPVKSLAEEKAFASVCDYIKENTNQQLEENVGVLMEILADFDVSTNTSSDEIWFVHNGLFLVKWLFSTYPELIGDIIVRNFEAQKMFFSLLVNIITKIEVTDESYHLVLEATDILTIVSYSTNHLEVLGIEKVLMESLLHNFIGQKPAPVFPFGVPSGIGNALASGVWSVMTVGLGAWNETVDVNFKPLPEKSFNLIKELLETRVSCVTVLSNLLDVQDINFSDLHYILLGNLQFAYLLKALLAINMSYRKFVITGTDLNLLLCPILKDIYEANKEDDDFVDKSLALLQIISTDEMFNKAIHSINALKQISWYKERSLNNIKLGGFTALVLLRAVLNSKNKQQLRNSCMDVLMDMSGQFRSLDLYPCERIVSSIVSLLKKSARLGSSEECIGLGYLIKDITLLINNSIVNQTQHNPNLLYSLLYKKDVLKGLVDQNPHFLPYFVNIFDVVDYLSLSIDDDSDGFEAVIDTEGVLKTIKEAADKYPKSCFVEILESEDSGEESLHNISNEIPYESSGCEGHSSFDIEVSGNNKDQNEEEGSEKCEPKVLLEIQTSEVPNDPEGKSTQSEVVDFELDTSTDTVQNILDSLLDDIAFDPQIENILLVKEENLEESGEQAKSNVNFTYEYDENNSKSDVAETEVPDDLEEESIQSKAVEFDPSTDAVNKILDSLLDDIAIDPQYENILFEDQDIKSVNEEEAENEIEKIGNNSNLETNDELRLNNEEKKEEDIGTDNGLTAVNEEETASEVNNTGDNDSNLATQELTNRNKIEEDKLNMGTDTGLTAVSVEETASEVHKTVIDSKDSNLETKDELRITNEMEEEEVNTGLAAVNEEETTSKVHETSEIQDNKQADVKSGGDSNDSNLATKDELTIRNEMEEEEVNIATDTGLTAVNEEETANKVHETSEILDNKQANAISTVTDSNELNPETKDELGVQNVDAELESELQNEAEEEEVNTDTGIGLTPVNEEETSDEWNDIQNKDIDEDKQNECTKEFNQFIPEKLEDIVNEEYRKVYIELKHKPIPEKQDLVNFTSNIKQQNGPLIFFLNSEMLERIDFKSNTKILIKDFDILESEVSDETMKNNDEHSLESDSAIENAESAIEDDDQQCTQDNTVTNGEAQNEDFEIAAKIENHIEPNIELETVCGNNVNVMEAKEEGDNAVTVDGDILESTVSDETAKNDERCLDSEPALENAESDTEEDHQQYAEDNTVANKKPQNADSEIASNIENHTEPNLELETVYGDDVNVMEGSEPLKNEEVDLSIKEADEEDNEIVKNKEKMKKLETDNSENEKEQSNTVDENSKKILFDSAIYQEFAKHQRLISFEQTHQNEKNKPKNHIQKRVSGSAEKISTNLCLNGYNIKFDVLGPTV